MPVSKAQLAAFTEFFGFEPDETSLETVKGLVQTITTQEAAADAAGIASKAAPPTESTAIDYDKLAETMLAKLKADGDTAVPETAMETTTEEPDDQVAGEYIGDLSPDAFRALLREELAAVMGTSEKAAPPAQDAKPSDLEAKINDLTAQLKALTEEQPRSNGYRPSQDVATVTTASKAGPEDDPYIVKLANEAAARYGAS